MEKKEIITDLHMDKVCNNSCSVSASYKHNFHIKTHLLAVNLIQLQQLINALLLIIFPDIKPPS